MGKKLPVGVRAGGTAASVPAQTEDSEVIPPPPHQSLHAAATHNPELARAHTPIMHPVKPLSQTHLYLTFYGFNDNSEITRTSHNNRLEIQAANLSAFIRLPGSFLRGSWIQIQCKPSENSNYRTVFQRFCPHMTFYHGT